MNGSRRQSTETLARPGRVVALVRTWLLKQSPIPVVKADTLI